MLKLKEGLEFYSFDSDITHVYDVATSRHFKLGSQEVRWLKLLDGTRTIEQLATSIPYEYFQKFLSFAERMSLLESTEKKKVSKPLAILKIKLLKLDPAPLLNKLRGFSIFYAGFVHWLSIPVFLINMIAIALYSPRFGGDLQNFRLSVIVIPVYLVSTLLSGLLHELSHALVATSFGIKVPRIGVMLFFLQPAFYADVSAINLLSDRQKRVRTLLAGMQANNLLAFLGIIVATLSVGTPWFICCIFFVAMNTVLIFINLMPFAEYDGYYIFQELIGEPRFNRNAFASTLSPGKKKAEYLLYFLVSQAYQQSLTISALILLRLGVNQFWTGRVVDLIFLGVIVCSIPLLAISRLNAMRRPL